MAELAEIEAPATIEASVNYMVEDGQQLFTYTGGPWLDRYPHRRHGGSAYRHDA